MRFHTASSLITLVITLILILLFHSLNAIKEGGHHYVFALNNKTSLADFNFAAAGDWGCNRNTTKNTINNIIDKKPELVIGLGDFAYKDRADCWFKLTSPIYDKMKITLGNHDHSALQQYMTHFNLSREYYSFNRQNVHFIAISTEVPYEAGSKQYSFVERDLQKSSSDPNIKWIVVFYHRLAYTSPALIDSIALIRDTYHPLFEKYGVDLVMQGHSHNYQRTFPILYNATNSLKPIVTDKNTTNYYNPKGQIFTITGTGGTWDIHNFTGPAAPYTAVQFTAFGFLDINVTHNGTVLEGKFYDNKGGVDDHFKIEKSPNHLIHKNSTSPSSTSSSTSPSSTPYVTLVSSKSSSSPPSQPASSESTEAVPRLNSQYEDKFKVETVVEGLRSPTNFAFLGPNDILVTEKRNGTVERVLNGQILDKPLLDVNVANKVERGMLGIAISKETNGTTFVFLYYTQSKHDGDDSCKLNKCSTKNQPIGNRLYEYELTKDHTKLVNPKLLLDLTAIPGPGHNGGKMVIDNDSKIFIIVGDIMADDKRTQNYQGGKEPDGTGGILKIDPNNSSAGVGILGNKYPLNLYYAYGIRNGFGLDFDPVTGNLWDTENGPEFGDEINLVQPGFNSGWKDVQGFWNHRAGKIQPGPLNLAGLDDFGGKGKYSPPEFTWNETVGPTGIKFFNSDKMGPDFKNSLFVGDFHSGNLYHFSLNDNRTALLLNGTLADKIANSPEELEKVIFGERFGGITDLEVGPDGYLYVLSIGQGAIYKIVPQ
jgi:aldose sugar dehydrogenase